MDLEIVQAWKAKIVMVLLTSSFPRINQVGLYGLQRFTYLQLTFVTKQLTKNSRIINCLCDLGKLLHLSKPQLLYLYKGDNNVVATSW